MLVECTCRVYIIEVMRTKGNKERSSANVDDVCITSNYVILASTCQVMWCFPDLVLWLLMMQLQTSRFYVYASMNQGTSWAYPCFKYVPLISTSKKSNYIRVNFQTSKSIYFLIKLELSNLSFSVLLIRKGFSILSQVIYLNYIRIQFRQLNEFFLFF